MDEDPRHTGLTFSDELNATLQRGEGGWELMALGSGTPNVGAYSIGFEKVQPKKIPEI